MRKLHHPLKAQIELANVLYALGDPVRLAIVQKLALEAKNSTLTRSCKQVCHKLDLPKSTLSHHFRILREMGVIQCEKQGTSLVNHLRSAEINARFPGLLKSILKASEA
jgi:DNA-binding transcriptional ArsR family regulator